MSRVITALACVLLLSACVPPQGDRLEDQIADDPTMLAMVDSGRLRIGIPLTPAGVGADTTREEFEGLTTAVGGWVADALGVEASFEYLTTDGILEAIEGGRLDLGFPVMPMTEGAVRSTKRSYTAPYFVAHQRVLLTSPGEGIEDVDDVCVFGDARTQIPTENIAPRIEGVRSNDGSGCLRLATAGIVDAIAAPDLLLFEIESALDGSVVLPAEYNTEGYGAIVQFGETPFANFVDSVLAEAIDDGRWTDAYEDHIAPLTDLPPEPPDLTAEEAAALFPRGLKLK
jgi:ABC-type amino acid transport substrate-binding protein